MADLGAARGLAVQHASYSVLAGAASNFGWWWPRLERRRAAARRRRPPGAMIFLDGICGTFGADKGGAFDDESEAAVEEVHLMRTAEAAEGVRRQLCARFDAAAPRTPLSFSAAELHVLRKLCDPETHEVSSGALVKAEKNHEEVYDRLHTNLKAHTDDHTAASVMSAFGATPKSRRAPTPSSAPKERRRVSFKAAVKAVIRSNRLHRALQGGAPPPRTGPVPLRERVPSPGARDAVREAFRAASRWDFDVWAVHDACDGDGRLAASLVAEELIMGVRKVYGTCKADFGELIRTFFVNVLDKYEAVPSRAPASSSLFWRSRRRNKVPQRAPRRRRPPGHARAPPHEPAVRRGAGRGHGARRAPRGARARRRPPGPDE